MCVVNLYAVCVYVCGVWCVFASVVCSCLLCEQMCEKDGVYNVYVYAFVYSTCVYNVFICSLCMHVPCVCEGVCVYDVRGIYVGVCIHMWCLLVCMCSMFICGMCGVCIACMMYVYVCGGTHTL